jgi:hypothetical protein
MKSHPGGGYFANVSTLISYSGELRYSISAQTKPIVNKKIENETTFPKLRCIPSLWRLS